MILSVELIGYIASALVAISLVMASFLVLRILNLAGAAIFVVYGVLIGSIPIVITNAFITVIDLFYLLRMARPSLSGFEYVSVGEERRAQVTEFASRHLKDIQEFFPDFSLDTLEHTYRSGGSVYLALRDLGICGFALCMPVPVPSDVKSPRLGRLYEVVHNELFPAESRILPVDYVVKRYRGIGLTNRLHRQIEDHSDPSIRYILVPVPENAAKHRRFLHHHHYRLARKIEGYDLMVKTLTS